MPQLEPVPLIKIKEDYEENSIWKRWLNNLTNCLWSTGTFEGTLEGFSTNPTLTVHYSTTGGIASLWIEGSTTSTSNDTELRLSGLPTALRPGSQRVVLTTRIFDNGEGGYSAASYVTSAGTINFEKLDSSARDPSYDIDSGLSFTASSTKGLENGWTISYPL